MTSRASKWNEAEHVKEIHRGSGDRAVGVKDLYLAQPILTAADHMRGPSLLFLRFSVPNLLRPKINLLKVP